MQIVFVLSLLIIAIVLFALDKWPVDIITAILLLALIIFGIITPEEAFKGFSSDFIIILVSIFVMSGALLETGVLDKIGSNLMKLINASPKLLLIYIFLISGVVSFFMNNTTVTALFIGPILGVCKKINVKPSKILIPLSFASILGGTCTLVGTSTNIAVSGLVNQSGFERISLFEVFPVGIILFMTGLIYFLIFGKYLLPSRNNHIGDNEIVRQYLSEIYITNKSTLVGQKALDSNLQKHHIRVHKIIRKGAEFFPDELSLIHTDDFLIVQCKLNELIKIKESIGIEIKAEMFCYPDKSLKEAQLAEVLVTPHSSLINKTLRDTRFRRMFNVIVLAIHRFGHELKSQLGQIRLQTGDLLLLQGSKENIDAIKNSKDFTVLGDFKPTLFKEMKGILTLCLFLTAVLASSFQLAPISVSFMTSAVLTVALGSITSERAYQLIEWRLIVLIGGMSAFGVAMEKSGASEYLASIIAGIFSPLGKIWILAAFVILVVILTQPMSNAAAALVVVPIAIRTAIETGANPRSFAIAIMLGASVSLITPFEPSCILVYGPGNYKFSDFLKIGGPLTIILIILIILLVPIFWPL